MSHEYTDPLVKVIGSAVIVVVGLSVFIGAVYWIVIAQIDSRVEYCPDTKTNIPVRDCKEVK